MIKKISYLIAWTLLLISCSDEIEIGSNNAKENPVKIQVIPKQTDLETKTTTYNFYSENLSNIKIYRFDGNLLLDPNGLSPIGFGENTKLDFSSSFIYPYNNCNVTVSGFYPLSIENNKKSMTANEIAFSISGHDDLMYASAPAGNKSNPISVDLTFDHKLAQIKFKLKRNVTDSPELVTPLNIIAIGPNTGTMNLTNGDLSIASDTTGIFALPTNLTFDQLTSNMEIEIPGELLLFPKSKYSFSLLIGNNYYPVTFDQQALTTSWNESSVYTLTISINSLSKPTTTPVVKENI